MTYNRKKTLRFLGELARCCENDFGSTLNPYTGSAGGSVFLKNSSHANPRDCSRLNDLKEKVVLLEKKLNQVSKAKSGFDTSGLKESIERLNIKIKKLESKDP